MQSRDTERHIYGVADGRSTSEETCQVNDCDLNVYMCLEIVQYVWAECDLTDCVAPQRA